MKLPLLRGYRSLRRSSILSAFVAAKHSFPTIAHASFAGSQQAAASRGGGGAHAGDSSRAAAVSSRMGMSVQVRHSALSRVASGETFQFFHKAE